MAGIFIKLLNMSISASYLVLAVLLLRVLLKNAPKWINLVLWSLVGLRLAIPFNFQSVLSLIPSAHTIVKSDFSAPITVHSGFQTLDRGINRFIAESVPIREFAPPAAAPAAQPAPAAIPTFDWMELLGILWLIGFLFLLVFSAVSFIRLRQNVEVSVRIRRDIYVCDYIDIPFILGFLHPRIYLPSSLRQEDVRYVVAHEKSHLKNLHHIYKPIGFLLFSIYWFNPLILLAYIFFSKDIELACDEDVIKDFTLEEKKAYSYALLSCSSSCKILTPCPLAFGEVSVKERVKKVLRYKKPGLCIIALSVSLCLLSACFFLTDPKEESSGSVKPADTANVSGAKIRYPDLVPEEVEASSFYQEALRDETAHIIVDAGVITAPDAVINFFNAVSDGKEASFTQYRFSSVLRKDLWKSTYHFDGENITEEIRGTSLSEGADPENFSFDELLWEDHTYTTDITSLRLLPSGILEITDTTSSEPGLLEFFNDIDTFPDYEKHQALLEQYIPPIYFCVITGDSFEDAEGFFKTFKYLPCADGMIRHQSKDKENFWTRYPDANMPFDDFYKLMSQYFEIDKDRLYELTKRDLNENNEFHYEGGLGGGYPTVILEDVVAKGDTTSLFLRFFNVDGSYTADTRKVLTVKNMPDGSFRYLSMKDEPCAEMVFGDYVTESVSRMKSTSISSKKTPPQIAALEPKDAAWWWENYVRDLAYSFQDIYPSKLHSENQAADIYRLMVYAVRHGKVEVPTSKSDPDVKLPLEKAKEIAPKALGETELSGLYLDHITDKNDVMNYYVSAVFKKSDPKFPAGDDVFRITDVTYLDLLHCEVTLSSDWTDSSRIMSFEQNKYDEFYLTSVRIEPKPQREAFSVTTDHPLSIFHAQNESEHQTLSHLEYVGMTESDLVMVSPENTIGLLEFLVFDLQNLSEPHSTFFAPLAYGENAQEMKIGERGTLLLATDHNLREYDLRGNLVKSKDLPSYFLEDAARFRGKWGSRYIYTEDLHYIAYSYPGGLYAADLESGKQIKVCDVTEDKFSLSAYPQEIKDGTLSYLTENVHASCLSHYRYFDLAQEKEISSPYDIPSSSDHGIQFQYVIGNKAIGLPNPMMQAQSSLEIYDMDTHQTIQVKEEHSSARVDGENVYLFTYDKNQNLSSLKKVDLETGALSAPLLTCNYDSLCHISKDRAFLFPFGIEDGPQMAMAVVRLK